MSTIRRSARIAANNAIKLNAEIAAIASAFHNSHYENEARPAETVTFVQSDLASYNPTSREYLVTTELMKRQREATCDVCRVEYFISILSWLIQHPQLFHEVKGLPTVVHNKMLEVLANLKEDCSSLYTGLFFDEVSNEIRDEKLALLCAYNEARGYIKIVQMILDKK
jgi:hypothetical protein